MAVMYMALPRSRQNLWPAQPIVGGVGPAPRAHNGAPCARARQSVWRLTFSSLATSTFVYSPERNKGETWSDRDNRNAIAGHHHNELDVCSRPDIACRLYMIVLSQHHTHEQDDPERAALST